MHVHILGICGTFMGGLALLARAQGHKVTGSDTNVYPPMSTQLEEQGIELIQGFDPIQLGGKEENYPDIVVIGNAMSRGNPCVEYVLNKGIKYTSGPQFLSEHILSDRWVLAVSGTHGKTSTASMLSWILEDCGYAPGFLIGGVPQNFGVSARVGESIFFVVEADEYDSAFFDKRSKFVHYKPRTLVINNLEFDHADIFDDLKSIQRQFHHLIRTIPSDGKVIWPVNTKAVAEVIEMGLWSEQEHYVINRETSGVDERSWLSHKVKADGSEFDVIFNNENLGRVSWSLIGQHNIENAIMAIAAARHVGVTPQDAIKSLMSFMPPKRRMELIGAVNNIEVYDDFAHHPTAIATSIEAMRAKVGTNKVIVILEPRSNTMKNGTHSQTLAESFNGADEVYIYQSDQVSWNIGEAMNRISLPVYVYSELELIIEKVASRAEANDTIIVMSNGGFGGIHKKLLDKLEMCRE